LPIRPVGGVNVTGSPEPVSVTAVPFRSPCCRLLVFEPENADPLVCAVVVVAVVVAPFEPVVVALVSVLLLPTILLLPVIVIAPLGVVVNVAPLMKKVRSLIAVAFAMLVLVAVADGDVVAV
jgi:hypothetical protein